MITFRHKGNFKNTEGLLKRVEKRSYLSNLDAMGRRGVEALEIYTPKDTGKTASSWSYEIIEEKGSVSIVWSNSNVNNYVNIAVILQYGHATKNGGWIEGVDYINPAMQPIFEEIRDDAWEEVIGR